MNILSTTFDISTASYSGDNQRFDIQSYEDDPTALAFNDNGTKMFVLGMMMILSSLHCLQHLMFQLQHI